MENIGRYVQFHHIRYLIVRLSIPVDMNHESELFTMHGLLEQTNWMKCLIFSLLYVKYCSSLLCKLVAWYTIIVPMYKLYFASRHIYSATRIIFNIVIVLFLQQQAPVPPVNFLAQVTTAPVFWIRIQRLKTGSIGLQSEKRNLEK